MACNINIRNRRSAVAVTAAIFAVVVVIFVIVFVAILDDYGVWSDYDSFRCDNSCENMHQCDEDDLEYRPVVQQPVNSWTNLAYILAGLWPMVAIRQDVSTVSFLLSQIYLGICSFLFHASLTNFWRHLDVAGMYTVQTCLVFHGIYAITNLSWNWLGTILLGLGVAFAFIKRDMEQVNLGSTKMTMIFTVTLFALHVILVGFQIHAAVLRRRTTNDNGHRQCCKSISWVVLTALTPGIIFGLAVFIRSKDADKSWCMPDSFWQGHGAWHCLTAFASLLIWIFFDRNRVVDIGRATEAAAAEFNDNEEDLPQKQVVVPEEKTLEFNGTTEFRDISSEHLS